MYMLTNLWQNILCKAQYLKLQYFWFLKQTKKTYQKDFKKTFALHCIRGRFEQYYMPAGLALQTCNGLQKTGQLRDGKWTCISVYSPEHRRVLRIVGVGERDDCGGRAGDSVTAGDRCDIPVEWNLPSRLRLQRFSHKTKLCFHARRPCLFFWHLDFVQDRKLLYTVGLDCSTFFCVFVLFCFSSSVQFVLISL